jgi:hypothetical protein
VGPAVNALGCSARTRHLPGVPVTTEGMPALLSFDTICVLPAIPHRQGFPKLLESGQRMTRDRR